MGNLAIRAENLAKRYTIGAVRRRQDHLTDALGRRLRRFLGAEGQPETDETTLWALQDVSLEIAKGETVGLIGRNGSGKSTLLKIFSRITEPTRGRAALYGRFCSLLEVGTGFHPELTGRDNIYLSGSILGMKREEIDRKFDEIVAFSEVERFIDTPVKHYSSGMHVRLGFAVIAHLDPEILIVDEVLAVGDGRFQKKCLSKMQEAGDSGRTVLFVSHDMSAVTRLCKKAIVLEAGRVVQEGPAHQVVGQYLYGFDNRRPSQEWLDPATAPQDDIVRMRAMRIRTEAGLVTDSVGITSPVAVEIEFDVLKPGHRLVPNFGMRNEEGVIVFVAHDRDPTWANRPRPVGRYVSTAWIPGNLLTEGSFIVGGGVITEVPYREHCDVPEAVMFHVVEGGEIESARGEYTGTWYGAVRPLLKWSNTFTPSIDE